MGKNGTTLAILHGDGVVGKQWCEFIQKILTEELPEDLRDMNLVLLPESVNKLEEDNISNLNGCEYKMLLLDVEILKILKDDQSSLLKSEIMETRQDQMIILLLGNEDDSSFNHDARYALSKLEDNEAYNILQAKNPQQILSDVVTILSPMYVVPQPNILSCEDKEQHLTLISSKPFPTGHHIEYVIEFSMDQKKKEASATLFNPYTLLLPNPGHPPGLTTVKILICTKNPPTDDDVPEVTSRQIGDDLKIWFQSDMDKVYSVLESQTNPMAFLCQCMDDGHDQNAPVMEKVDKLLTESYKKHVPDNKMSIVFGNAQNFGDDQDGYRSEYVPTLLHFSAMYGLRDLTANLLQCPGAVHAYGTANCEGDYPTNLAEKSGHWELRDFMITFMEVAAMVHDDYSDNNMQTSQIMSGMVYGQYLSFMENTHIADDIYVPIDGGQPFLTPPGYVPMHPAARGADQSLPQSVDYDFMLRRMLESNMEEDYEELDVPATRMLSDRRQSAAPFGREIDAPPPVPPPREERQAARSLDPSDRATDLLPNIHSCLTSAQEELISLQKKVKNRELTINQAVFRFKEWERKNKERAASFQHQQENLQRIRGSLIRSREERRKRGDNSSIKISDPITAGSSTYDRVLLKTRKEVMHENSYGGNSASKPAPTTSRDDRQRAEVNEYSRGFGARTSFKAKSLGRPPVPAPGSTDDGMHRGLRYGSRGSVDSSRSSFGSNHRTSLGSVEFPTQSAHPVHTTARRGRSSLSDASHPPVTGLYHLQHGSAPGGWGSPPPPPMFEEPPPPPLPPRDDVYSAHARQRGAQNQGGRPFVPPRSPLNR